MGLVPPRREAQQALVLAKSVERVEHLDRDEHRERHLGRVGVGVGVGVRVRVRVRVSLTPTLTLTLTLRAPPSSVAGR